jgi:magnesium chelatase family protein
MDRIDIRVEVDALGRVEMMQPELGEPSALIRERVIAAREIAALRFASEVWALNSEIPSRALRTTYQPERAAMNFLHNELDREHITARGLHKVMRVAWSVGDLTGHVRPTLADAKKAFEMREGLGT